MIDGVCRAVARIIEFEQPYARWPTTPRDDRLWVLSDLNNTDKHRVIPVAIVAAQVLTGRESPDDTTFVDAFHAYWSGPLEDQAVLLTLTGQLYEYVDAQLTCTVAFEQAQEISGMPASMASMLWNILSRVHEVVDKLRPFVRP